MTTQTTVAPSGGPPADSAHQRADAATVAERFNVSERTVQRLAAKGAIPSYRVGRQLRFNLAEVDAALRDAA